MERPDRVVVATEAELSPDAREELSCRPPLMRPAAGSSLEHVCDRGTIRGIRHGAIVLRVRFDAETAPDPQETTRGVKATRPGGVARFARSPGPA